MLKPAPLIMFLNDLKDPRSRGNSCEHKFIDILIIAICAIMSDGETWEDMENYGHDKEDWLRTFLELPYGIPSHDTFYRIFCALDPEAFETCFIRWVRSFFSAVFVNIVVASTQAALLNCPAMHLSGFNQTSSDRSQFLVARFPQRSG